MYDNVRDIAFFCWVEYSRTYGPLQSDGTMPAAGKASQQQQQQQQQQRSRVRVRVTLEHVTTLTDTDKQLLTAGQSHRRTRGVSFAKGGSASSLFGGGSTISVPSLDDIGGKGGAAEPEMTEAQVAARLADDSDDVRRADAAKAKATSSAAAAIPWLYVPGRMASHTTAPGSGTGVAAALKPTAAATVPPAGSGAAGPAVKLAVGAAAVPVVAAAAAKVVSKFCAKCGTRAEKLDQKFCRKCNTKFP